MELLHLISTETEVYMKQPYILLAFMCIVVVIVAGCTGSSSGTSGGSVQVQINSSGSWAGSYGAVGEIHRVDGTGSQTYTITDSGGNVMAEFQKHDGSADQLTVSIIENGQILKTANTTAAYGTVSITTQV